MTNHEINVQAKSVQDFSDLNEEAQELIKTAIKARNFAYVPYSNFKVGSAIRVADGTIVSGCNIENSAFSPTICSERTAACKAGHI
ncbi:cytidine deaminase-like [Sitodiplosis mosellana]|uniref:cytidine deaminase-like n=1 Tax=Sitodiplosis mosellana TaxID=263140 RepID=UPI0024447B21|nr:cytidine deaminase-like [Sitodiplosis mosellana]